LPSDKINYHFHISAAMAPSGMFRVRDALMNAGLKPSIRSLIIPEGCSGLLSALEMADKMLPNDAGSVLITAESDMSLYSHQRTLQNLTMDNIDKWLWGVLFGEGVGAMLVGRVPASRSLTIGNLQCEIVENDWRVALNLCEETDTIIMGIKARAVKRTYLEHVTRNAQDIIALSGGVDRVSHLCLHESNPKLVARVAENIGMPIAKTVSVCKHTGSLAGVSIFSLLDTAFNSTCGSPLVAAAVIGEAGGVIRAGRFTAT
jgi:3-oxoacyl-[acyl-carrier-protein] synthase III